MNNESEVIAQKQNYLTPARYISGRIVEYDIKSANISTLAQRKVISIEEYNRLSNLPKIQREVEVGIMEKNNPELYTEIQKGIISAKVALVRANNIHPDSILRIANDAVYINTAVDLQYTKFGDYILFIQKSISNVMLILDKLIFFVSFLPDGNISIDIKGLGDKNIDKHQCMINAIVSTITILERSGIKEAINYLSHICEQYITLQLPVEYYREINSESSYRIKQFSMVPGNFAVDYIEDYNKYSLDINYNYSILRELWSIMMEIYNINSRRN